MSDGMGRHGCLHTLWRGDTGGLGQEHRRPKRALTHAPTHSHTHTSHPPHTDHTQPSRPSAQSTRDQTRPRRQTLLHLGGLTVQ